ncbi:class I SAM-dependent methyltransferase [Williamsia maris]|uniref:Class I SAM-dependent methyltransferase n=1 Tax=Williamsia maris TaxID=72806 RepID=A0ABT1HIR6_9NOCA|nr:class I SAM-dependent methyltransferase [Williamsia maris]MCP2177826.1 hypothetical protein [Williamsia maris]
MRITASFDRSYEALAIRIPPKVAGRLDTRRPQYSRSWGGPLNGQHHRREMVREIAREFRPAHVVETGTYRGTSTEFFSAVFGVPIDTAEASERYYEYSARRLAGDNAITVHRGDSRGFLSRLASRADNDRPTFFYLDAHWNDDLPLAEELQIISSTWRRSIVMIDDFQVPDDPGYAYDDYGSGKALVPSYLPGAVDAWSRRYPSAPSGEETGARRGSCLLFTPDIDTSDYTTVRSIT